jgi:hypothetical protein
MEVIIGSPLTVRALVSCLLLAAAVSSGCSGSKVTTKSSAELPRYTVHSLALVPFTSIATPQARDHGDPYMSTPQSVRRSDISVSVPSNVEPSLQQTVVVPAYASEKITQLFWRHLQRRAGLHAVLQAGGPSMTGRDAATLTPEAIGQNVANQLKVDAAMIGQVLVYQERVGSRLGASPPASVGFEATLVAADGQVLWVGNYYERQRPMTEDLMGFIRRHGAFVTAEELAQYGVEEVLKEFPFGTEAER